MCFHLYEGLDVFIVMLAIKNMDVEKCVFIKNCICTCAECDICGSGIENCDDCLPVCEQKGDFNACEYYDVMEVISEANKGFLVSAKELKG